MGYLILFAVLWLLCVIAGIFIRASIPTTVQPTGADMAAILLWSTVISLVASILVAGIVAILFAFIGALT